MSDIIVDQIVTYLRQPVQGITVGAQMAQVRARWPGASNAQVRAAISAAIAHAEREGRALLEEADALDSLAARVRAKSDNGPAGL